jgi:hypothetical protein
MTTMGATSAGAGSTTTGPSTSQQARREARVSMWMLAVFAVWTAVFIAASGPVAELLGAPTSGGEVLYIKAWLPWIAVTVLWLLPLFVGLGLALDARRRDRQQSLPRVAALVHVGVMVVVAGPALLDRLLHLG